MKLTKYIGLSILSGALILAAGVSCFAKNSNSVTFSHDVVVNGTTLPAGHYSIHWNGQSPEATVVFSHRRKIVLSTEGTLVTRKNSYRNLAQAAPEMAPQATNLYDSGEVVYDTAQDGTRSLVEIRLADSNKVLVFSK